MPLVLASASPRRADLLRGAGFVFEIRAVDVDESPRAGEAPHDYVRRLSMEKSACGLAGATAADLIVLGADTAVVVDGAILGKPKDDADAEAMLRRLSGRRHEVMTGVSLRTPAAEVGLVATTVVTFNALSEAEIAWYVASGEGRDKAGAYGIQGLGSRFIPRIEGSYSNVVGLPVAALNDLLKGLGSGYPLE